MKPTGSGGPCGYDAGKKIKGRKRHIVTDTDGHLIGLSGGDGALPLGRPDPAQDGLQARPMLVEGLDLHGAVGVAGAFRFDRFAQAF